MWSAQHAVAHQRSERVAHPERTPRSGPLERVREQGRAVLGDEIVGVVEVPLPRAAGLRGSGAAPVHAEHLESSGGEDVGQ